MVCLIGVCPSVLLLFNSLLTKVAGQWDTFFSRFSGADQSGGVAALQQHQQRLREMGAAAAAQQQGGGMYPSGYSGSS